jgi:hypothetical protein
VVLAVPRSAGPDCRSRSAGGASAGSRVDGPVGRRSAIADIEQAATWTLSSLVALAWAIVVGFGHPSYSLVLRLTGGPDPSR